MTDAPSPEERPAGDPAQTSSSSAPEESAAPAQPDAPVTGPCAGPAEAPAPSAEEQPPHPEAHAAPPAEGHPGGRAPEAAAPGEPSVVAGTDPAEGGQGADPTAPDGSVSADAQPAAASGPETEAGSENSPATAAAGGNGGNGAPPAGSAAVYGGPYSADEPSPLQKQPDEPEAQDEENDRDRSEPQEDRPMTLREHLAELRARLFKIFLFALAGFMVCFYFQEPLFQALMAPLNAAMPPDNNKFMYTGPAAALFAYMKMAFVLGFFLTSPLSFYQIWAFIAPGLHREERRYLVPIALCSAFFFVCGAAFCYFITFPFVFDFLMGFNSELIESRLTMQESLGFVLQLLLAFGFIFELPLFVFFLARMGLVTAAWMRSMRRYAVLVSIIVGALLTPPDVISQLLMAGPLIVLYEVSIVIAAVFGRKKPRPETEEQAEADD